MNFPGSKLTLIIGRKAWTQTFFSLFGESWLRISIEKELLSFLPQSHFNILLVLSIIFVGVSFKSIFRIVFPPWTSFHHFRRSNCPNFCCTTLLELAPETAFPGQIEGNFVSLVRQVTFVQFRFLYSST